MSYKDLQSRYALLARVFVILAVLGVGMLIFTYSGDNPSELTFSLIAFVISVAALLLTTIQSTTIVRQMQMTEHAAREVRETGEQLKSLIGKDQRLAQEVRQDIQLDHEILAALQEHGIGESDDQRHDVARHIAKKLRQKHS